MSIEEVRQTTFRIDDVSSPGPDGFGSKIFKYYWELIKDDLVLAMQNIFMSDSFINKINHTFFTLVLEKKNAPSILDFRPISYCNVIYKIIANIICTRIKGYMNGLISLNQNACILGRFIIKTHF